MQAQSKPQGTTTSGPTIAPTTRARGGEPLENAAKAAAMPSADMARDHQRLTKKRSATAVKNAGDMGLA